MLRAEVADAAQRALDALDVGRIDIARALLTTLMQRAVPPQAPGEGPTAAGGERTPSANPSGAAPRPAQRRRGTTRGANTGCNTAVNRRVVGAPRGQLSGRGDDVFAAATPPSMVAPDGYRLTLRGRPLDAWIRPRRAALDWVECSYRVPIAAQVWLDLTRAAEEKRAVTIKAGAMPVSVEVFRRGMGVVLQTTGLRITVLDPAVADRVRGRSINYVEVQVQGAMLSESRGGGEEIALAMYDAVNAALYPDYGASAQERRAALRSATRPGAWHLAVDLDGVGADADAWLQGELFAGGSLDGFFEQFSTHARTSRMVSSCGPTSRRSNTGREARLRCMLERNAVKGRSGYLGCGTVELCVYERSKKTCGDWKVLQGTLASCGWDGQTPVVRWEIRCRRTWFRDQEVTLGERRIRGNEMVFEDFLVALPGLAAELTGRFRHTVADEELKRKRERRSSPLQMAVEHAVAVLADSRRDAPSVVRVLAVRRTAATEHAVTRGRAALADIAAVTGTPARECADRLLDAYNDPRWRDERIRRQERAMQRHGIVEAPPLAGAVPAGARGDEGGEVAAMSPAAAPTCRGEMSSS
jgi:hypothetical protein